MPDFCATRQVFHVKHFSGFGGPAFAFVRCVSRETLLPAVGWGVFFLQTGEVFHVKHFYDVVS